MVNAIWKASQTTISANSASAATNGFRLNSLNLTLAQDVPNNASMLIITQPQIDLLQGEIDKLLRYIASAVTCCG